jgi:spermidine synthase
VLGLASGITAGETLHYPIKQLDVVDINDRVEAASRFFEPWNNKVLDDARTNLIFQDGRAHLALTEKQYDVIISEPSNPWMAGMATLFTKDFFQIAKNRLTPNGVYVQWFHCYQMDWTTFALIGRTFATVFPQSLLVSTSPEGLGRDYLLVGLNSAAGLNWDNARKSITYLQRSENISMASPELYARQIVSENLTELFGQGPINSDDQPLLEYMAPRLMHSSGEVSGAILQNLTGNPGLSEKTRSIADNVRRDVKKSIDFAAYALSVHAPFKNMADLTTAAEADKRRFNDLINVYAARNPIDLTLFDDPELVNGLRDLQVDVLKKEIDHLPFKEPSYTYLARLYDEKQMSAEALFYLQKAIELDPNNAGNHNNLGYLFDQAGKYKEAEHHYLQALRVNPYAIITWGNLGFLNLRNSRPDKALNCFEAILRVKPDQPDALYQIGLIFAAKKDLSKAAEYLRKAIEIDPQFTDAINALAQIQNGAQ